MISRDIQKVKHAGLVTFTSCESKDSELTSRFLVWAVLEERREYVYCGVIY